MPVLKLSRCTVYVHSVAKHEEQNILTLKLVLLCLKCKVSSEQLSQMSSKKSNLHLGIKPTLYLYIIYVGLRRKCMIFIPFVFSCFSHI